MDLQIITDQAQKYANTFTSMAISSDDELTIVSEQLSQVKQKLKKMEELRKSFTSDLNKQLKTINGKFKDASAFLKEVEVKIKNEIIKYHEAKRIEAEKLLEEKKEEGTQAIVEAPQTSIKTSNGCTSIKKVWSFEIIDPNIVPKCYLSINEPLVREAIKNGEREIEGIKIFQKSQISVR